MVKHTEFYGFLGVEPDASDLQIRRAYLRLAIKYHPDKNDESDTESKAKFQRLQKIHSVLKHKTRRFDYDRFGENDDDDDDFEQAEEGDVEGSGGSEMTWSADDFMKAAQAINPDLDEERMKTLFANIQAQATCGYSPNRATVWSDAIVAKEAEKAATVGAGYLEWPRKSISSLPSSLPFARLNNVREFVLDNNHLTSLPAALFTHMTSLEVLSVKANKLTKLSDKIDNLASLRVLNLDHNQLTTLPSSLGSLVHLTHLSAFANRLSALPVELDALPNIRKIDVECNYIKTISPQLASRQTLQLNVDPAVKVVAPKKTKKTIASSQKGKGKASTSSPAQSRKRKVKKAFDIPSIATASSGASSASSKSYTAKKGKGKENKSDRKKELPAVAKKGKSKATTTTTTTTTPTRKRRGSTTSMTTTTSSKPTTTKAVDSDGSARGKRARRRSGDL
eukprot:TRINITY_DN257_c0_g4_i1.p1 TRINITY_DN257_c0_g4~~TRINITY_DN257_c0_g4_i1.p1  ORF type:complete len:460 (-),score=154.47 TRINITY_DN257_c0_g4_i1:125-1477(-)